MKKCLSRQLLLKQNLFPEGLCSYVFQSESNLVQVTEDLNCHLLIMYRILIENLWKGESYLTNFKRKKCNSNQPLNTFTELLCLI